MNAYAKLYIEKNEIIDRFLLAGDKFMPEMHLKQPGFTYSACEPLTKNKKRNRRHRIFTKMNLIRLAFNTIWLMEILKI